MYSESQYQRSLLGLHQAPSLAWGVALLLSARAPSVCCKHSNQSGLVKCEPDHVVFFAQNLRCPLPTGVHTSSYLLTACTSSPR